MKKKWMLILFGGLICLSGHAYLPDLADEEKRITAGRYFLQPHEVKHLRSQIQTQQWIGLYIKGENAYLRPVSNLTLETGNIKRQVGISLPNSIRVTKKRLRNKQSGLEFQYIRLKTVPMPVVFLSLPHYCHEDQELIIRNTESLPLNGSFTFEYKGISYELIHQATLHDNDYPSDIRITLRNHDTGQQQLLSVRDQMRSTRSYVVFAGDIDGDGKLDLILDESPRAHHGHLTLYLSSAAMQGEMVAKVAEEINSEDPPYELLYPKN